MPSYLGLGSTSTPTDSQPTKGDSVFRLGDMQSLQVLLLYFKHGGKIRNDRLLGSTLHAVWKNYVQTLHTVDEKWRQHPACSAMEEEQYSSASLYFNHIFLRVSKKFEYFQQCRNHFWVQHPCFEYSAKLNAASIASPLFADFLFFDIFVSHTVQKNG